MYIENKNTEKLRKKNLKDKICTLRKIRNKYTYILKNLYE